MNSVCLLLLAQQELPAESSLLVSGGPVWTAPETVEHTVMNVEGSLSSIWSVFSNYLLCTETSWGIPGLPGEFTAKCTVCTQAQA